MKDAIGEAQPEEQPKTAGALLEAGKGSGERPVKRRLTDRNPGEDRSERPAEIAAAARRVRRRDAERARRGVRGGSDEARRHGQRGEPPGPPHGQDTVMWLASTEAA